MVFPHRPGALFALIALALACPAATLAADAPSTAFGVGLQRMPSWLGARTHRDQPVPFFDIERPDSGFALSSSDGLQWDFLRGTQLHGGLYGNFQWGRDHDDLGASLDGKIGTLAPRLNAGGYLEWEFTQQLDAGMQLSHDTDGAGAYLTLYAEWDPPHIGWLHHSLQLRWQAMNGQAMRRFFGVSPAAAAALDTPTWQPGAGPQMVALEYDAFLPTSEHTGLAASLEYAELIGAAGASPLVRDYGARYQVTASLAFVYHL